MVSDSMLNYEAKKWYDVWCVIDNFDIRHEKQKYPYQSNELEQIISAVHFAIETTKKVALHMELDFYQIESCLNTIIKNEKPESAYLRINLLKDAVHHLYIKLEKEN